MQRIIIDTNVLVAALISYGIPYTLINEVLKNQEILICYSPALFKEYEEVLNRKKFAAYPDFKSNAAKLLLDIEVIGKNFEPKEKIELIKDQDDNKLLELAAACKAHFIITGNTRDFSLKEFRRTKIVTPREYWDNYEQRK